MVTDTELELELELDLNLDLDMNKEMGKGIKMKGVICASLPDFALWQRHPGDSRVISGQRLAKVCKSR
ncbi:hypothetical protein B9Z45_04820 [Limnohabitans sp. 2KL-17]|nr:hypothetical protein B9Z45_04820 [Limnohabitans sp. 2KL-17]